MPTLKAESMGERRALVTDRERDIIAGEADVTDSYRYQTISRVRSRLDRLEGDLEAFEKHGDLADELREIVCGSEAASETRQETPEPRAVETPAREPEPEQGPAQDDEDELRDILRDGLAGEGDILEARVDAILSMYTYLREHGKAEKADLLNVVDIDATWYDSPDSVWSNMVKGRETLKALPGVKTPPTGRSEWRYVEGDDGE